MLRQTAYKRIVKVRADHLFDGRVRPLMFREEDGPAVVFDRVEDVREAAALKAGGQGTRYLCRVGEQRIALFDDNGCWFIEGSAPVR